MATKKKEDKTFGGKSSVVWGVEPAGFKRIGFTYKDKKITFRINPKEYDYSRPTRASVYKTQNSNVVQLFGADLATITIKGTTGWHKDGNGLDGKGRLDELNKLFADYQNDTQNGGHSASDLKFNNYTDNKFYTVTMEADGFSYHRDDSAPLLFDYSIFLYVIGGDDTPVQDSSLTAVVGTGSGSSISKGTDATSPVSKADSQLVNTVSDPHATKQSIDKAVKKLKKKHGK